MKKRILFAVVGTVKENPPKGFAASTRIATGLGVKIDEVHLIYNEANLKNAEKVRAEISELNSRIRVELDVVDFKDPWDFKEVYGAMLRYVEGRKFDELEEDYYVSMATGSHVTLISFFNLVKNRFLPAKLLELGRDNAVRVVDLNEESYDDWFKEKRLGDSVDVLSKGIETRSEIYGKILRRLGRVAEHSKEPILLTGETGVGKTQLAKEIFRVKRDKLGVKGDFFHVNCATLVNEALAVSELFGHRRGAFTGAISDYDGILKRADKGVVFLDEIGTLNLKVQAMLLTALEEKCFFPLSGVKSVTSDFQLICGTNSSLEELVRNGEFREDLLARINLWTFRLPALRERSEDIEPNIGEALRRFEKSYKRRVVMNKEAKKLFVDYASHATWKGNFRDFNAAVMRMATFSGSAGRIGSDLVQEEIERLKEMEKPSYSEDKFLTILLGNNYVDKFDDIELCQLKHVLSVCRSARSLSEAGRTLYNCSRLKKTVVNDADRLKKFLKKFDLTFERICEVNMR